MYRQDQMTEMIQYLLDHGLSLQTIQFMSDIDIERRYEKLCKESRG